MTIQASSSRGSLAAEFDLSDSAYRATPRTSSLSSGREVETFTLMTRSPSPAPYGAAFDPALLEAHDKVDDTARRLFVLKQDIKDGRSLAVLVLKASQIADPEARCDAEFAIAEVCFQKENYTEGYESIVRAHGFIESLQKKLEKSVIGDPIKKQQWNDLLCRLFLKVSEIYERYEKK